MKRSNQDENNINHQLNRYHIPLEDVILPQHMVSAWQVEVYWSSCMLLLSPSSVSSPGLFCTSKNMIKLEGNPGGSKGRKKKV